MGMALAAIADDADLLALDQVQVGIAIVINTHDQSLCFGGLFPARVWFRYLRSSRAARIGLSALSVEHFFPRGKASSALEQHRIERGDQQQRHGDVEDAHRARRRQHAAAGRCRTAPRSPTDRKPTMLKIGPSRSCCRDRARSPNRSPTLLIAATSPLTLTHWNSAAPKKLSGLPRRSPLALTAPDVAISAGEIEQVGGADILQHRIEQRIGLEDRAEPEARNQHDDGEAEADAQHVRDRAAEAEVQTPRPAAWCCSVPA